MERGYAVRLQHWTPTMKMLTQQPNYEENFTSVSAYALGMASKPSVQQVKNVTKGVIMVEWTTPSTVGYSTSTPINFRVHDIIYYLLEVRHQGCNITVQRIRCENNTHDCDFTRRQLKFDTIQDRLVEVRMIAGTVAGDGEPSDWVSIWNSDTTTTRVCTFCGSPGDSPCAHGEYPVGDCTRCAACTGGLRGAWNFTSAGVVDDPASCGQACAAGWFRDWFSEECRPHTQPACGADQYLLAGTPTSDAFCAQCRSCAGMRRTRACNSTGDGKCQACAAPAPGLLWLHENCTAACAPGYVWNVRTERCEACDVACAPGSRPPAARHNCTHCAACPAAPQGATFTRGCSWSCGPDQTVQGEGTARQCTDLLSLQQREPATPAPTASACAEHQKLETVSFKAARCVDCDVVTPSDDSTWTWTKLAGTCSWACNAGLYKYFRTGVLGAPSVDAAGHRHVDCVAWPVYAALSRDPSQPITLAETQQYFAGRAVAGARALRAGLGFLLSLILTAVVMTQ